MPHFKCPECKAKYYSASKNNDSPCEKCGGKLEEEIDQRFMVQKGNNKYCCEYCAMFHYEPEEKR